MTDAGDSLTPEILGVIDRMIETGWVCASAYSQGITSSQLTDEGVIAVRLLRRFLAVGGKITAPEFGCFLSLIQSSTLEFVDDDAS
ncbi:MAG: hypothetical protein QOE70_4329 [Chthoniobacter sp.]|jgi:hypothetical protein|nr:hypothetical protein [Chthoniobacter sp.]